ncbi:MULTISPECIES: META domain-containing protein [Sphingobacterium]|uniref:META domain-containing protein n=1 Tax=Sphingobacterium populi TaxID=1812824 RepID=A0ABW5UD57_9SPHI|nr:META domain-containing protein [Sphingobacterium sp. CFCC 11742]
MKYYYWIMLVAFSVLITSCSVFKKNESEKSSGTLENVTWRLTELEGKAVPAEINGKTPSLTLTTADKRYSAVTGCNGIGGQYEIAKGNQLTFSMGMSTKMYCEGAMEVEDGLGKIFSLIKSYEMENGNLHLKNSESVTLAKFVKMSK